MIVRNAREMESVRAACRVTAETLQLVREHTREGVTTRELDRIAEEYITRQRCLPAFKGYRGYPATLCTSVNEQIVHGIPSDYELRSGDILSVDVGAVYKGYYGDAAVTILIGKVAPRHALLAQAAEEALYKGLAQARTGNRVGDISHAVESHVERFGFTVVREFVGHGLGTQLHEAPQVPNYGAPATGARLKEGMLLAIEPMVNEYTPHVRYLPDKWTATTIDGGFSAHFEHTVIVTANGPEIMTRLGE